MNDHKRSAGAELVAKAKDTALSMLEQHVVELFVADPELSAARVAEKLNLAPSAVLTILKRPEVRKMIGLGFILESKDRLTAVRNSVILALSRLAEYDPKECFDEDGNIRQIKDMPDTVRFAIKSFKPGKFGLEIQFYDRAAIMQHLLQYLSKPDPLEKDSADEKTTVLFYESESEEDNEKS